MLGLLLVLACNAGPHPLAQLDLREERAALLAADSAFAVQASQALLPAFRDILDDDAIFLDPGERVVVGKAATLAMLAADGGAGYTYGFGSVTGSFGPGGAARALPVKYIAYWRKHQTGAWRLAAYVRVFQRVTAPADPPAGFESPRD